jgi:hypothetical protein
MQEEQYIQINKYGHKFCYKDKAMTVLHRTDGPAIEWPNGDKEWFVDGKLHRIDGPAIECADGCKEWFVDGKLHRIDGPAIECADGYKAWYVDDKRHRSDGPAIEWADGTKFWYVDDKRLTEKKFKALTKPIELTLDDIAAKFGVDVNNLKIVK